MKGKHFRCDCGWAFHSLYIEPDWGDESFPCTSIQVVCAPPDLSLSQRIRAAWHVLRGDEHVLSEIYIHRDDMGEFIEYVIALSNNPGAG